MNRKINDLTTKAIEENTKLKKIIKMLINKLDIVLYEIHENGVTEYYLDCSAGEIIDDQEEYKLLKEILRYEKW